MVHTGPRFLPGSRFAGQGHVRVGGTEEGRKTPPYKISHRKYKTQTSIQPTSTTFPFCMFIGGSRLSGGRSCREGRKTLPYIISHRSILPYLSNISAAC